MFADILTEHIQTIETVKKTQLPLLEKLGEVCLNAITSGHTLFFMGNGGSAADSQHLAAEFVGRFQTERRPLPAIALTTDTSILTAIGNDYGFDQVFVRQVQALVRPGDVVIGISTSGNSNNILQAVAAAKERGAMTIGMTAEGGGSLQKMADYCFSVPTKITARAQEAHILAGHMICQYVDEGISHVS